jgi:uncharacterized membrane protein YphA (DoxX/SURF4 family)
MAKPVFYLHNLLFMNDLIRRGVPVPALHYTLRIAAAMCFIGHGTFGIITKPIWCNYFAVFGIGHDLAYQLMPILGAADILMGISLLVYPTRAILVWLVGWGLVTASLRPLSGEPFAELIERAGNFGAPLALLLLSGGGWRTFRDWFTRIGPDAAGAGDLPSSDRAKSGTDDLRGTSVSDSGTPYEAARYDRVALCLRIVVALLLLGHGWLNLIGKKGLLLQYEYLGFSHPAQTALFAGLFEILAAAAVLVRPVRPLLVGLLLWKIATELFYPHWEVFEWIERGGSYGSLLALLLVTRPMRTKDVRMEKKPALY